MQFTSVCRSTCHTFTHTHVHQPGNWIIKSFCFHWHDEKIEISRKFSRLIMFTLYHVSFPPLVAVPDFKAMKSQRQFSTETLITFILKKHLWGKIQGSATLIKLFAISVEDEARKKATAEGKVSLRGEFYSDCKKTWRNFKGKFYDPMETGRGRGKSTAKVIE